MSYGPSSWGGEPYELRVTPSARRQLGQLPDRIAAAIIEFMLGALIDNPKRLGRPLRRELAGHYSARRGAYRIIYKLEDDTRTVVVVRVDHRSTAYRPR